MRQHTSSISDSDAVSDSVVAVYTDAVANGRLARTFPHQLHLRHVRCCNFRVCLFQQLETGRAKLQQERRGEKKKEKK